MPGLLFELTSFLFFAFIILNTLSWLNLWEENDHDWKRLILFLKDTKEGRSIIAGPLNILKWLVIFSYGLTIFIIGMDGYFHLAVFVLYGFLILNFIRRAYVRQFEFPRFHVHTAIVLVAVLIVEGFLYLFPALDRFLWLLILDKILPVFLVIFTLFTSILFDFSQDVVINRAISKIGKHKNLLSIIVVGSYAKGATKEFITRILKMKYNVFATKSSFNTPLGIARTINSGLTSKKQIFIAEMEDYKKGDIAEMCRIVKPKIAVLTGINDRNISLLGNIERIMDSKFEAIESLSNDGIALFNSGNKNVMSLYKRTRNKKFTFSSNDKKSNIYIKKINEEKFSTNLEIVIDGKPYKINKIRLIGRQIIESLLPGIYIGVYLGIDFVLIRKVLQSLRPLPHAMNPKKISGEIVMIDDTFNVNVNSIDQIVNYVSIYTKKKILVLEPLTFLGSNSRKDHLIIGEKIGNAFSQIFLTNANFNKEITRGVKKINSKAKVEVANPLKIAKFIDSYCKSGDVIVLEGKEARRVMSAINYESIY